MTARATEHVEVIGGQMPDSERVLTEDALDFPLDVMGKLTCTKLGKIYALARS